MFYFLDLINDGLKNNGIFKCLVAEVSTYPLVDDKNGICNQMLLPHQYFLPFDFMRYFFDISGPCYFRLDFVLSFHNLSLD